MFCAPSRPKAVAVLHCAAVPTALSTDLSARREEEKLIILRRPEGLSGISQQTIIMSHEGWEHKFLCTKRPFTIRLQDRFFNTYLITVWEHLKCYFFSKMLL